MALINRGNKVLHDHVIDMLQDMEPERFEKNVIYPLIEKKETELDPTRDRYMEFFDWMVKEVGISFEKTSDNGEEISERIYIHSGEQECVLNAARRYANFDALPQQTERQRKIATKLLNERTEIRLEQQEIIDDKLLFDYIKEESWIGECVKIASSLYERIKKKQNEQALDLDELLF